MNVTEKVIAGLLAALLSITGWLAREAWIAMQTKVDLAAATQVQQSALLSRLVSHVEVLTWSVQKNGTDVPRLGTIYGKPDK